MSLFRGQCPLCLMPAHPGDCTGSRVGDCGAVPPISPSFQPIPQLYSEPVATVYVAARNEILQGLDIITPEELAVAFRTSLHALSEWRRLGTGPKHIRVGKKPFYRTSDVARWLNEAIRSSRDEDDE